MTFPLNVAIASSVRTPVGRGIKGSLKDTRPDDLAAAALNEAMEAKLTIEAPFDMCCTTARVTSQIERKFTFITESHCAIFIEFEN